MEEEAIPQEVVDHQVGEEAEVMPPEVEVPCQKELALEAAVVGETRRQSTNRI